MKGATKKRNPKNSLRKTRLRRKIHGGDVNDDLLDAIRNLNFFEVKKAINNGAIVNPNDGRTNPLIYLFVYDRSPADRNEIFDLLIEKGADVNAFTDSRDTVLHLACKNHKNIGIIKKLVNLGANINAVNNNQNTPLMISIIADVGIEIPFYLIEKGAKLDLKGSRNLNDALHLCFKKKLIEKRGGLERIALKLIESGADVNSVNRNGETPLHLACANGYLESVNMLIDKGADKNAEDNIGLTPLIHAMNNKHNDIVDLLINTHNVETNRTFGKYSDEEYSTNKFYRPLNIAASQNNYPLTRELMLRGEDPWQKGHDHNSIFNSAQDAFKQPNRNESRVDMRNYYYVQQPQGSHLQRLALDAMVKPTAELPKLIKKIEPIFPRFKDRIEKWIRCIERNELQHENCMDHFKKLEKSAADLTEELNKINNIIQKISMPLKSMINPKVR